MFLPIRVIRAIRGSDLRISLPEDHHAHENRRWGIGAVIRGLLA